MTTSAQTRKTQTRKTQTRKTSTHSKQTQQQRIINHIARYGLHADALDNTTLIVYFSTSKTPQNTKECIYIYC